MSDLKDAAVNLSRQASIMIARYTAGMDRDQIKTIPSEWIDQWIYDETGDEAAFEWRETSDGPSPRLIGDYYHLLKFAILEGLRK